MRTNMRKSIKASTLVITIALAFIPLDRLQAQEDESDKKQGS